MAQRHHKQGMIIELPIDEDRNLWLREYEGGEIKEANWQEYTTNYGAGRFIYLARPSFRDKLTLHADNKERHPRFLRGSLLTHYVGQLSAVNSIYIDNPRSRYRLNWALKDESGMALANIGLSAPGLGPLAALAEKMDAPADVVNALMKYGS
jgi:hypothetical protein